MGFVRMARPTRRKRSSNIQFRERLPLDVQQDVRGRVLTIPLGDGVVSVAVGANAKEIALSLRTPDPNEGKARHSAVQVHLANIYRSLRITSPRSLTHAECVSIAGDIYRAWAAGSRTDELLKLPDFDAQAAEEVWSKNLERWNAKRESGRAEEELGPLVDRYLFNKGLRIDAASRAILLTEVARALADAFAKQMRNAGGDYTPDANASRFPVWQDKPALAPDKSPAALTFDDLLTHWEKARSPAPGSIEAFHTAVASLKNHLGHNDPRGVTKADIRGWRDALRDGGRVAKTVNNSYLALVRTLYRRARKDELLDFDPVEDIRDETKRKAGTSPLPYEDDEVTANRSGNARARTREDAGALPCSNPATRRSSRVTRDNLVRLKIDCCTPCIDHQIGPV